MLIILVYTAVNTTKWKRVPTKCNNIESRCDVQRECTKALNAGIDINSVIELMKC